MQFRNCFKNCSKIVRQTVALAEQRNRVNRGVRTSLQTSQTATTNAQPVLALINLLFALILFIKKLI